MKTYKCVRTDIILKNKKHEASFQELEFTDPEVDEYLRYNEYFIIDNHVGRFVAYKTKENTVRLATIPDKFPIKPMVEEHKAAIHAISFNEDIKIILLIGPAGGGKSYISIGCGLNQVKATKFKRLLLIRNNVPASTYTLGLLPGGLSDKMYPWFGPTEDIVSELCELPAFRDLATHGSSDKDEFMFQDVLYPLVQSGLLRLSTPEFMRGASKHNMFVVVDDFQNFTKKETDLVMTRFGNNCKIILCGDDSQVDNLRTNGSNSGIQMIKEMQLIDDRLQKSAAIVEFSHSECRGEITRLYVNARKLVT